MGLVVSARPPRLTFWLCPIEFSGLFVFCDEPRFIWFGDVEFILYLSFDPIPVSHEFVRGFVDGFTFTARLDANGF